MCTPWIVDAHCRSEGSMHLGSLLFVCTPDYRCAHSDGPEVGSPMYTLEFVDVALECRAAACKKGNQSHDVMVNSPVMVLLSDGVAVSLN